MKKKSANPSVSLPKELIMDILLRLPVSSLLRFKCVSKSWHSIICDSQFVKLHFDLALAPSDRCLHRARANDNFIKSSNLSDDSVVSLCLPPTPSTPCKWNEFWGSCRGFVLLSCSYSNDLIVWNPSTGEHKRVPHPSTKMNESGSSDIRWNSYVCGFGYDESTDDYLVVLVKSEYVAWQIEMMFFSVKTNSWNYIVPYKGKRLYQGNLSAGLLLNGALHWLAQSSCPEEDSAIIAFDLVQRSLSEIPLPTPINVVNDELHIVGGCLSVLRYYYISHWSELWMMKEYKVLSSWTPFPFCVCDDGVRRSYPLRLGEITGKIFGSNFSPLRLEEFAGKIIGSNFGCLRLDRETRGEIFGTNWCCRTLSNPCEHLMNGEGLVLYSEYLRVAMYRESLLSLPTNGATN